MGELLVLFGMFLAAMFAIKALVGEQAWQGICDWGQRQLDINSLNGSEEASTDATPARDDEIAALKRRIETLEAIVTDQQFDLKRRIDQL